MGCIKQKTWFLSIEKPWHIADRDVMQPLHKNEKLLFADFRITTTYPFRQKEITAPYIADYQSKSTAIHKILQLKSSGRSRYLT